MMRPRVQRTLARPAGPTCGPRQAHTGTFPSSSREFPVHTGSVALGKQGEQEHCDGSVSVLKTFPSFLKKVKAVCRAMAKACSFVRSYLTMPLTLTKAGVRAGVELCHRPTAWPKGLVQPSGQSSSWLLVAAWVEEWILALLGFLSEATMGLEDTRPLRCTRGWEGDGRVSISVLQWRERQGRQTQMRVPWLGSCPPFRPSFEGDPGETPLPCLP